jgi:hypothetical protein
MARGRMLIFIKKNIYHILIWGLMFLYLISARDIYVKFFLSESEGKPVEHQETLPPDEKHIASAVARILFIDKDVFRVSGWILLQSGLEISDFEGCVVLQSEEETYFFPIEMTPNVENRTSFRTFISREFIHPGAYRIGFFLKHKMNSKDVYYSYSNKLIIRTPNSVNLENYEK